MIIAIDGPAASGKGTLARRVADHLGYACLDTGLLYRAVARDVMARGAALDDEGVASDCARRLDPATLDDPSLRSSSVGEAASVVARLPAVRKALLEMQRAFSRMPPGAVLDGRDIATVVCPDADVKIFVTAKVEERARRRHKEQADRGEDVSYEAVLEVIRQRDARDSERAEAPMRIAAGAVVIDTTEMTPDDALANALEVIAAEVRRLQK